MPEGEPHPLLRDVGRRIAELRQAQALTQGELATRVDVTTRHLQSVEHGEHNLSLLTLEKYARALGVEVVDLLAAPSGVAPRRGRPPRAG